MSMKPIDGSPGMFRDTNTDRVFNIRDFAAFEELVVLEDHQRFITLDLNPGGKKYSVVVMEGWGIGINPWPEEGTEAFKIFMDTQVKVMADGWKEVDSCPLERVAVPVGSPTAELRHRVEVLEKRFNDAVALVAGGKTQTAKYGLRRLPQPLTVGSSVAFEFERAMFAGVRCYVSGLRVKNLQRDAGWR